MLINKWSFELVKQLCIKHKLKNKEIIDNTYEDYVYSHHNTIVSCYFDILIVNEYHGGFTVYVHAYTINCNFLLSFIDARKKGKI